jgi:RND family efflux transporter MFP subunit
MTRPPLPRAMGLAVLLGAALLVAACDKKAAEAPPPVRPVLSLVVEPKAEQVFGPFTGTVEPRYQTALGFRAAGRMMSRDANVGDLVAKGQLLASLDPRVARFALASATADLANAQAQLVNATATAERQLALLKSQAVAQAQVDSAVAARDTAQARVNQSQASLTKAQEQFAYTELHTDFDGVITTWSLEVGQVVTAGQTVVTVARPDVRDAVFDVPDELIGRVQPGTVFQVTLQANDSVTAKGEVREVAPQADGATRTRRIRLTLKHPPSAFRLGTTVTMTLANDAPPRIELPASAIVDRDGQASVWMVSDKSTVQSRAVTLGAREGDGVTVAQGLAPGDRVITAGVHSLSDGQPVKLEP